MQKLTFGRAAAGFLLPLTAVISLVLTGNDILIALFGAVLTEVAYCLSIGFCWAEIEAALMKGGSGMLGASLLMMLVGMMIAVWMASGTIPALLYFGMKLIHPRVFLPVTFLFCLLASLATGTSWGAAGTMGIALLGVAAGMGIPLPLVVGCIVSGVVIGNMISPLSDCALLTSASTGAGIFDLIPCMLYTAVPMSVLCLVVYGVLGFRYADSTFDLESINTLVHGLESAFHISAVMLIPLLMVVVMSIKKCPGLVTFPCSIVCGIVLAVLCQGNSVRAVLDYAVNGYVCSSGNDFLDGLLSRGGALSMGQTVFVALMAGMLSGSLKYLGILDVLMARLKMRIKSSASLIFSTVCVCLVLLTGGGGQYPTLTLPGAAFRELYQEMDIHPAVLGRTMEDVGTIVDPIIPWTVSGIYYSGLFGVSVAAYVPYTFIALLAPLLAIVNARIGLGMFRCSDVVRYRPFWRRK